MAGFSSPATRRYSLLSSARPGTKTGPCSPPLRALSRLLRSSCARCVEALWQVQQLDSKIGLMSFSKEDGSWARGASVEKAETPRTIAAAVNRQKARLKARLLSFRVGRRDRRVGTV